VQRLGEVFSTTGKHFIHSRADHVIVGLQITGGGFTVCTVPTHFFGIRRGYDRLVIPHDFIPNIGLVPVHPAGPHVYGSAHALISPSSTTDPIARSNNL